MHTSRKSHRKSRKGCLNCKKRKIKCDEQKPFCGNCIKHSIRCDFATRGATTGDDRFQSNYLRPQDATSQGDERSPVSSTAETIHDNALNMQDLELLHNFTTSTALTMHNSSELQTLWRINMPQLAFSHDYLMRAVLSLSALHLAHGKPQKREYYLHQAAMHQDVALRTAAPLLARVDASNCSALYAMTALAFMYSVASPQAPKELLLTKEEGVTSWLTLLRGMRNIINPHWQSLVAGPLGPMFKKGRNRVQVMHAIEPEDHVGDLRRLIVEQDNLSAEDIQAYQQAIDLLNPLFGSLLRGEGSFEYSEIITFMYRLEERFLDNLFDRKAHALVILAHYCVLLKQLEHHWWVGTWGVSLFSRIYELLDVEYRLWIQRPIELLGWIP